MDSLITVTDDVYGMHLSVLMVSKLGMRNR